MIPPDLPSQPDEAAWLEVIRKMDEVYSQLVADEVALEQKNEELERTQQFLFSLLTSMSDVLVACNEAGEIEQTNAALCELVGKTEPEIVGQSVYALLTDNAGKSALQRIAADVKLQRGHEIVELNFIGAKGQPVPVDVNCTLRVDGVGRHVGWVLVGRPMGEVKRAYRELSDAHEALKKTQRQLLHSEKMASLGRLVAGVAHELNNPISFVLGNVHALKRYSDRLTAYIESLHQRGDGDPQLRKSLRIDPIIADMPSLIEGTVEGAQRTAAIVNGLKRFSAMDREEREQVDLNQVVSRAIQWMQRGGLNPLDVHYQPSEAVMVCGSSGQLLQVMMNLIQNACDAVSITGIRPEVRIAVFRSGEQATVSVRDNGPGIAPQHLSKIFEPFFTTKPVGKGTGLGLSISYGIVERHGGSLEGRNLADGGCEFIVRLPAMLFPS